MLDTVILVRIAVHYIIEVVLILSLHGQFHDRESVVVSSGKDVYIWVLTSQLCSVLLQALTKRFVKVVLPFEEL